MIRLLALLLFFAPVTANAGWVDDLISKYSLEEFGLAEFKDQASGDVYAFFYGWPLAPAYCKYLDYKRVNQCLIDFVGEHKVKDLPTAYPQCFLADGEIPESVRVRCVELNPFRVQSWIFGTRALYDIQTVLAWRDSGKVGQIPLVKIGSVATQTVCEARIVMMVGEDVLGIATNEAGLRGATKCK